MDRPKTIRRIRIIVSAICLLCCAAFLVLWIRSYSWQDHAHCPLSSNPASRRAATTGFEPSPRMLTAGSVRGRLSIRAGEYNPYRRGVRASSWGMISFRIGDRTPSAITIPRWNYEADQYGKRVSVPHWAPALIFGVLAAAAFGIRRVRFSLRTLDDCHDISRRRSWTGRGVEVGGVLSRFGVFAQPPGRPRAGTGGGYHGCTRSPSTAETRSLRVHRRQSFRHDYCGL